MKNHRKGDFLSRRAEMLAALRADQFTVHRRHMDIRR